MPPSAKLVFKVLERNGELTQQRIVEESMLPQRTVRCALGELESAGIVGRELSFRDARQRLHSIAGTTSERETTVA